MFIRHIKINQNYNDQFNLVNSNQFCGFTGSQELKILYSFSIVIIIVVVPWSRFVNRYVLSDVQKALKTVQRFLHYRRNIFRSSWFIGF